jgi:hypothetical protein
MERFCCTTHLSSGREHGRKGHNAASPTQRPLFYPLPPKPFPLSLHNPHSMTRQFFVGGNFKMNPATFEQKVAIVKTLNEAALDPSVGSSLPITVEVHALRCTPL